MILIATDGVYSPKWLYTVVYNHFDECSWQDRSIELVAISRCLVCLTRKLLLCAYKAVSSSSWEFLGYERLSIIKVEAGGSQGKRRMKG